MRASAWMTGPIAHVPSPLGDNTGPLWRRTYSIAPSNQDCFALVEMLSTLGMDRLIVGHTPQESGINSACDGKVWRIDTKMWDLFPGPVQVLELFDGSVHVLEEQ